MANAALRYTLRVLAKNPGFTTVAVLSLALGIGANTAIFTLINALLLRDLNVRQPDRLLRLSSIRPGDKITFSYPMFREVERGQRVFSALMASSTYALSNVEVKGVLAKIGCSPLPATPTPNSAQLRFSDACSPRTIRISALVQIFKFFL